MSQVRDSLQCLQIPLGGSEKRLKNPAYQKTVDLRSVNLPGHHIHGPAGTRFIHHIPAWRVAYSHRDFIAIYHHTIHLQNRLRSMRFLCKLDVRQTLRITGLLKLQTMLRNFVVRATAQSQYLSFTSHLGLS